MSDTFKFLDNKEGKAQDFLKGKMKTVANASEGVIPGGDAYKKYGKMPGTGNDTAASSTGSSYSGPDKRDEMFGADTDWGRNYRAGIYGGGDYDKDALAEKFGLDNSKEAEAKGGEENIYGTRADGSSVFLGRMSMDLASNSELIAAHSKQRHKEEGDHLAEGGNLDSMGDITGALLASWKDSGGQKAAAEPEPDRTPIKHSEEINEAKERVRSYEDSVLSGELSNDIYGQQNDNKNIVNRVNEKFNLDLNKGADGIGSAYSGNDASNVATDSFLDSKKTEVKKEYQFQPKTNSQSAPDDGSWSRQVSREKALPKQLGQYGGYSS